MALRPSQLRRTIPVMLLCVGGLVTGGAGAAAGAATSDGSVAQPTWSTLSPPGAPPPLANASAVYDSDTRTVVLFGGMQADGTLSDDTWVWDGSTWSDFSGGRIPSPPARQLASMAFDPELHQLILFGGRGSGGQFLGDTWAWNGASWYDESPQPIGSGPGARQGAALSYDGSGHLLLFGGTGPAGGVPLVAPGSTVPTTTTAPTTNPATAPPGTGGSGGAGHGGRASTVPAVTTAASIDTLADTWVWGAGGWMQKAVSGPPARTGAAMGYDSTRHQVILFGGDASPDAAMTPGTVRAYRPLADTWTWNGSAWGRPAAKVTAPPRSRAALADDPAAGGVILFGGGSVRGALADTWRWSGGAWAPAMSAGTVTGRAGAAAAYDANDRQLVMFGGTSGTGAVLGDTLVLSPAAPVAVGPTPVGGSTTTKPAGTGPGATPGSPAATTDGRTGAGSSSGLTAPLAANAHVLRRGDLVKLAGSGFRPGAIVTITFHSTPTLVGRVRADAGGAFSATVAVPDRAAAGAHRFMATGPGPGGREATLVAAIEVIGGPGSGGSVSRTQMTVMVTVAVLLPVATWLALGGLGRWRRRRSADRLGRA